MNDKEIAIKFINTHDVPRDDASWNKFVADYEWFIKKFPKSKYIDILYEYLTMMLMLNE